MDDSKKILKEYLTHAHALVLKESMRQKAEIIKLVKELLNRGVDYERIKKIFCTIFFVMLGWLSIVCILGVLDITSII